MHSETQHLRAVTTLQTQHQRERGTDFGVTSIVTSFNPGRSTFQWDKGIESGRKPALSSPNSPHKGAATGL